MPHCITVGREAVAGGLAISSWPLKPFNCELQCLGGAACEANMKKDLAHSRVVKDFFYFMRLLHDIVNGFGTRLNYHTGAYR